MWGQNTAARKQAQSAIPGILSELERLIAGRCQGLENIDALALATVVARIKPTRCNLHDALELISTASAAMAFDEPAYRFVAARFRCDSIAHSLRCDGIRDFAGSIERGHQLGLVETSVVDQVRKHTALFNQAIHAKRDDLLDYVATLHLGEYYLLRDPTRGTILETPQYFFLRTAISRTSGPHEAIELYEVMSSLLFMPKLSARTDPSASRSASEIQPAYLETWRDDVENFLDGDKAAPAVAHWIPDVFMQRVANDETWSLFAKDEVPELVNTFGKMFEYHYLQAEAQQRYSKQVRARDLYSKMVETLCNNENGWLCFKDAANRKSNQTARPGQAIYANASPASLEVTPTCNTSLASGAINLARHVDSSGFDFEKLENTVRVAVRRLDATISSSSDTSCRWRPLSIGYMGWQDVLFTLKLPFDSRAARDLSIRIAACIYYHALDESSRLAVRLGRHTSFAKTRASVGDLEFDRWGEAGDFGYDWDGLRLKIREQGLRNSLLIAVSSSGPLARICGCYPSVEPQQSNLNRHDSPLGEYLQVNPWLVEDLKRHALWTDATRRRLLAGEVDLTLSEMPPTIAHLYRTAWELPMATLVDLAADRGAYVDQSQTLFLYARAAGTRQLCDTYFYAWKRGLKTTSSLVRKPVATSP